MKKKNLILIFVFVLTLLVFNDVFAFQCENGQDYVACGTGVNAVTGIPTFVPRLISFAIALMRVLIPVILIITGTIEMFKSIISGNQDNIAKGKKKIIGKFVGALLAFFVISFVTNIVKLIARGDEKSVAKACFNCFLNNRCNDTNFACQGTADAKKFYFAGECSEFNTNELISSCPTDRCKIYYNGTQKECVELDFSNDINKSCSYYNSGSLIDSCPTDRCKICNYDNGAKACEDITSSCQQQSSDNGGGGGGRGNQSVAEKVGDFISEKWEEYNIFKPIKEAYDYVKGLNDDHVDVSQNS